MQTRLPQFPYKLGYIPNPNLIVYIYIGISKRKRRKESMCEFWLKQRRFLCSQRNNLKESVHVNSDERKHSLKYVGQLGFGLLVRCVFVMLGASIGIVGGV